MEEKEQRCDGESLVTVTPINSADAIAIELAIRSHSTRLVPLSIGQVSAFLRTKYAQKGCTILYEDCQLKVVSTEPAETVVRITHTTRITLVPDPLPSVKSEQTAAIALSAIGGYEHAKAALREVLLLPRTHPHLFTALGIPAPSGVLLKGPAGVGKTSLVQQMAKECNAYLITLDAGAVGSAYVGEAESKLREVFQDAETYSRNNQSATVAIFIDQIDLICPHRAETGLTEGRVVAQLLTLMDGQRHRGAVVVLAATNKPNRIDPALRRPGRFDREIEMEPPSTLERELILRHFTKELHLASDVILTKLAERCLGFVGADLSALVKETFICALSRLMSKSTSVSEVVVQLSDFDTALQRVVASSKRDIEITVPTTRWEDIGGLETVKQTLREAVEWPLKYAHTFKRLNVRPPRGILLHGPPGCSKTTLVKAVASSCQVSFLSLSGASVYSPFLGSAEAAVRAAFKKARAVRPCVIFFDELDAIVSKRHLGSSDSGVQERVLSTLLNEMDGVEAANDVLVVGATNRINMIDAALLRPGRFDHIIEVPLPESSARREILRIHTRGMPLADDVRLDEIADRAAGFSGAELENLCREAALMTLRENLSATAVHMVHLERSLGRKPSSATQKETTPLMTQLPSLPKEQFSISLPAPFQFV